MAIHAPFGYYAEAAEEEGLLLDTYTGSIQALSFRKLSSTYTGSCCKVEETATNGTLTVGFDANGYIDTAAIDAWNASDDIVITEWYDQSGNVATADQPVLNRMPLLRNGSTYETINGKIAATFDGASGTSGDLMQLSGPIEPMMSTTNAPFALFTVGQNPGTTISNVIRGRDSDSNNTIFSCTLLDTGNGQKMNFFTRDTSFNGGQRNSTSTWTINSQELWEWHYIDDSGFQIGTSYAPFFYESNVELGNTSYHSVGGTMDVVNAFLGGDGRENNFFYKGGIQEVIVYDAFKTNTSGTGDRAGINTNIQTYYGIT